MSTDFICNIWTFKTAHFTVKVDALIEDIPLDQIYDNEKELNRIYKQIEHGDLVLFCARATVFCDGSEMSSDYLGACIYKDYSDFRDHLGIGYFATLKKYKQAIKDHAWLTAQELRRALFLIKKQGFCYGSYFSDMVRTAITEARKYHSQLCAIPLK